MENLNNIFSSLRYPIRVSILNIMKNNLDLRSSVPSNSSYSEGFCPEDILIILKEYGYNVTYSKLSYHLKEMRKNQILNFNIEGKRRFYTIDLNSLQPLIRWLNDLKS